MRWRASALFFAALSLFSIFPCQAKAVGTSASAAILMDADSGRVLYEQNADARMLIASTTKILTALVAIREGNLSDVVTVTREAALTEGSSMYLKEGEQLTLETLLYGLMLCSGNDAAVAIADHVGGSQETFVQRMNETARELGMEHSSFANPNGLDAEGHYSTARDMAKLACAAVKNETLLRIASTKSVTIGGRTMTNQWGTLCLPFEIKSDQYATCKFYELKEVKETEIVLTEVTGNIPAGTPVLVRRTTESTDISLNATDAAVTTAPAAGSTADGLSLVGRFTASEALSADSYIISNNKFWRVSDLTSKEDVTDVKVGAFRAYLQADVIQNARMMSLSIGGDDTTGIVETLNDLTDGDAEYYDLGGKRQTDLQRGVNIVKRNGKTMKVIIK